MPKAQTEARARALSVSEERPARSVAATAPGAVSLPPPDTAPNPVLAARGARVMSDNIAVDIGRIASLMMEIDSELSRAARDSQVAQIQLVAEGMHRSADELRSSARMALAGGCVSGAAQLASAGITLGGGVKGMTLTSESPTGPAAAAPDGVSDAPSGKVSSPGTTLDADLAASQRLSARAQNIALVTQGFSQVASATGEIIKSGLDYESHTAEARSKDDEAQAERQRAYLERAKSFADTMQKGVQDMIQVYDQVTRSAHETASRIWSRA